MKLKEGLHNLGECLKILNTILAPVKIFNTSDFIPTFYVFSIYEKLIIMLGIDEKGTNYPPVSTVTLRSHTKPAHCHTG